MHLEDSHNFEDNWITFALRIDISTWQEGITSSANPGVNWFWLWARGTDITAFSTLYSSAWCCQHCYIDLECGKYHHPTNNSLLQNLGEHANVAKNSPCHLAYLA